MARGGVNPRHGDLENGGGGVRWNGEWSGCCSPGDWAPLLPILHYLSCPLPLCPLPLLPGTPCLLGCHLFIVIWPVVDAGGTQT
jgi:hypothetical protein